MMCTYGQLYTVRNHSEELVLDALYIADYNLVLNLLYIINGLWVLGHTRF